MRAASSCGHRRRRWPNTTAARASISAICARCRGCAACPAVTRDGTEIALYANLELPRELGVALEAGAQGIGLLRTEFMFMNRDSLPDEEEQYRALRKLIEGLDGRPMTARTLDVGGDKLAQALAGHHGASANPALGAARHPPLPQGALAARCPARRHAAGRGPWPFAHPAADDLLPGRSPSGAARRSRSWSGG